nr:hypothetical protein A5881_003773 [Enterococcus termitis]
MFELYDPDEIIKNIVSDNFTNLNIIEIRDFIDQCLTFYNDYEKSNPTILKDRIRAIEEDKAFQIWEDKWLSPE